MAALASIGRNGTMSEHLRASARPTRLELLNLVDQLIAEFPDQPAGVVIAQVVRARDGRRRAGSRDQSDGDMTVESAARERLLRAMSA
jgi:hypothetical protein